MTKEQRFIFFGARLSPAKIRYAGSSLRSYPLFISTFIFTSLLILPSFIFSQIEVINKGLVIGNDNDFVKIRGNFTHDGNGSIANTGNFYISGDWTNNNSSGNVFTPGLAGWVHLDSANQTINGSTKTHFNNLELAGSGVKSLVSAEVEIDDTLSLNDREFDAGDNTVLVTSSNLGVITRTTGYVSSTQDGGLSRNTSSTGTYFFPVGSNLGVFRFRPVEITPNSALANSYKVRMANVDATVETFDRTLKEFTLGDINPNFYHRINRTNGNSPANITIYYDNINDIGSVDFDVIAHWHNTLQWRNAGDPTTTFNYGFKGLSIKAFNDFSTTPFALSKEEIGAEVFVPNVFSPNGDGKNDILFVRGKGITELQFIIYDRWGGKIFETNDVNAGWDGTFKGEPMNLAVFVYIVKGKFKNGTLIDKKGNFTLLR